MRTGLLLGGGGTVGIAWESGVLAGLADACGFDPTASTVIVGTSAGSAVGADMALGKDPHDVLERGADSAKRRRGLPPLDMENGPFAEFIRLMMEPDATTPAGARRIGDLAVGAETFMTEDRFLEMFKRSVGTDEWPSVDFRPTTTNCATGERKVWSAADGIDLSRAVASSCAIPCYFPTVSFGDGRYMDSSRGRNYHAEIVADLDLDAAIFIGPRVGVAGVDQMTLDDMEAISAMGVRDHTILGSDRLDAAGLNLMDGSKRALGFEIGLADGVAAAPAIDALLG